MKKCLVSIYVLVCVLSSNCDKFDSTLGHITGLSRQNSDIQAAAVKDLINRILPEHGNFFNVFVDGNATINEKDFFRIQSRNNGTIEIFGTTGVSAASGFHYYLKYYCHCHISWECQQRNVPNELPSVDITIPFNDRFRYYQNVCTTSYSFVWWDWTQWEKHIDWMVMNSFNLVLAFNGQEAIWAQIYKELGLTQDDIDDYFTGPTFLSWLRMGNVRKWGGPLSSSWHTRSLVLQKSIIKRLRSFGVITVLPAFAGHLPRAFKRLYPKANMIKLGSWNNFNDSYCCPYFLNPTEDLFHKIGKSFIETQIAEYGSDHVYNCDSFNENTPPSTDISYLANVSSSIFEAMTSADPKAIWLMQNWLFVHDASYWSKDRAKALLTAVPRGKMIILDLQSEQFPQYYALDQYFGQPYIWCMLHNFGGTLGMYGNSDIINERPIEARTSENSSMIGTGLTMEGINQNYVIYDLMTETAWRNESVNLTEWFSNYSTRRYGHENKDVIIAWSILQKTIYNLKTLRRMRGQYAITRTPSWSIKTWIWYNSTSLIEAMNSFKKAEHILRNNQGYQHDVVDLNRQMIQVFNDELYNKVKVAYRTKDVDRFEKLSKLFSFMLEGLEKVLSANKAFSLKEWVKAARAVGVNSEESDWYEYNARNQITLWGPNGEIMNYAIKQWAGVVGDFLLPRWKLFLDYAKETLAEAKPFNQTYIKQKMFKMVEEPFTFKKTLDIEESNGDIFQVIQKNDDLWWKTIERFSKAEYHSFGEDSSRLFSDTRAFSERVSFSYDDEIDIKLIQ